MVNHWSFLVSGTKRLVEESLSDIETSILIEFQSISSILFSNSSTQVKFCKPPSHKTPTNKLHIVLCGYIRNSRDCLPLSKQLINALLRLLQWNK